MCDMEKRDKEDGNRCAIYTLDNTEGARLLARHICPFTGEQAMFLLGDGDAVCAEEECSDPRCGAAE